MPGQADGAARPSSLIVPAVAALFAALTLVALATQASQLHRFTVSLVAPAVVVQGLDNDLDGAAQVTPSRSVAAGRNDIASGHASAGVVVDLATSTDTLLLDPRRSSAFNQAFASQAAQVGDRLGRNVRPQGIEVPGAPLSTARVLTLLAGLAGLLVATVPSLLFGPIPGSAHRARLRASHVIGAGIVGAAGLCAVFGVLSPSSWVIVSLTIIAVAVATQAVEELLGRTGLAVEASVLAVLYGPLIVASDMSFIPTWVQNVWPWSPAGATYEGLAQVATFGGDATRTLALCIGWLALAVITLIDARREHTSHHSFAPGVWQLKVVATMTATSAAVILAGAVVPAGEGTDPRPAPVQANTLSGCTRITEPRTVNDLNQIARLPAISDLVGGDVGLDVLLSDGRRLWFFGDTLRTSGSMVRNSLLVRDDRCIYAVKTGNGGPVIPDRDSGVGYWPMSAAKTHQQGYDLVTVTTQRVRRTSNTAYAFETLGPSLAVFLVADGDVPQLVAQHDIGPDDPDTRSPAWGASAATDGDWLYLYGTSRPPDPWVFGFSVQVARVRMQDVTDPQAWRYWDGRSWASSPKSAAPIIPAVGGPSQTMSVFRRGNTWYMLSKQNEFLGSNVRFWLAPEPTGPFTPGPVVAFLPSDPITGTLVYMPLAHPELLPRADSVVISYSRNRIDFSDVLEDPLTYRPRFRRVWLPQGWW